MHQETGAPIRVLICDADRISSQLMASALRRSRSVFEQIELAASCEEARFLAQKCSPHVVLVSSELNGDGTTGFRLLQYLRESHPDARLIMLLRAGEPESVVQAFRGGVRGIIYRSDSFRALVKCIRSVHQGQIWASTRDMEYLLAELTRVNTPRINRSGGLALLTQRELEVTRLVAEGMKNRDIADALQVTEHTVCNYLYRMFDKLGVSSRVELILYALSREPLPSASNGSNHVDAATRAGRPQIEEIRPRIQTRAV